MISGALFTTSLQFTRAHDNYINELLLDRIQGIHIKETPPAGLFIMAIVKKKRSHHAKASTKHAQMLHQQQLEAQLLKQKQLRDNEVNRLKPEQISSVIHDESDTISFRANLLKNFVVAADYMTVLTAQPVPISKIKPPRVFQSSNPKTLRTIAQAFEAKLKQEQTLLDELKQAAHIAGHSTAVPAIDVDMELDSLAKVKSATEEYTAKHHLRVQDRRVIIHKDKFTHLKSDTREAPADYWKTTHRELLKEQKHKEKLAREEELRKKQEEETRRIREEEEKKLEEQRKLQELEQQRSLQLQQEQQRQREQQQQQEELKRQQQENQQSQQGIATQSGSMVPGVDNTSGIPREPVIRQGSESNTSGMPTQPQPITANAGVAQNSLPDSNELPSVGGPDIVGDNTSNDPNQVTNVDPNQQDNMLEDMFTEYNTNNNEPFSNSFDDEFGDGFDNLDNVFF